MLHFFTLTEGQSRNQQAGGYLGNLRASSEVSGDHEVRRSIREFGPWDARLQSFSIPIWTGQEPWTIASPGKINGNGRGWSLQFRFLSVLRVKMARTRWSLLLLSIYLRGGP